MKGIQRNLVHQYLEKVQNSSFISHLLGCEYFVSNKLVPPQNDCFAKYQTSSTSEPEYPNTLSKSWIPLFQMNKLYSFSTNFLSNITNLGTNMKIVAWKKVRGDGNCFYRAVMAKFMENMHKYYAPVHKLYDFMDILTSCDLNLSQFKGFEKVIGYFKRFIQSSIEVKESSQENIDIFIKLLEKLQEEEFDQIKR